MPMSAFTQQITKAMSMNDRLKGHEYSRKASSTQKMGKATLGPTIENRAGPRKAIGRRGRNPKIHYQLAKCWSQYL